MIRGQAAALPFACVVLLLSSIGCFGESGSSHCDGEWTPNGSVPRSLTVVDDKLFFSATQSRFERLLYVLDDRGRLEPVSDLVDAGIEVTHSEGTYAHAAFGEWLYFLGVEPNGNIRIWRTDGTNSRRAIRNRPAGMGSPRALTPLGDFLYFVAGTQTDKEFWRIDSDGIPTFVADAPTSWGPDWIVPFEGRIVFGSDRRILELYPDGSIVGPVAEVEASKVLVYDQKLYFSVLGSPSVSGLYVYDGVGSPERIADEWVIYIAGFRGEIYFVGRTSSGTGSPNNWLSVYDGVNPSRVIFEDDDSSISLFGDFQDKVHFSAEDAIWRTDSQSAPVRVTGYRGSFLSAVRFDGKIYNDVGDSHGLELWSFDGDRARLFADLYSGRYCYEDD